MKAQGEENEQMQIIKLLVILVVLAFGVASAGPDFDFNDLLANIHIQVQLHIVDSDLR